MFSLTAYLSLCLVFVVAQEECNESNFTVNHLFEMFMKTHGKVYTTSDEHKRRNIIFLENIRKAEELQTQDKTRHAKYGVTPFSDMSASEFEHQHLGCFYYSQHSSNITFPDQPKRFESKIPKNFDWRKRNAVTQVKYQGRCHACWAFSTTGNIEGLYAIKHDKLISLSEQELVDCDGANKGCRGGKMAKAYGSIIDLGGLARSRDYPYEATKGSCRMENRGFRVQITGGTRLGTRSEEKIARYLYTNGPLSVGINAEILQSYRGGILHPSTRNCNPRKLNHAMLLVGYGSKNGIPYWIVKNSWGKRFGERGYMRIYRGDGACGINRYVTTAFL